MTDLTATAAAAPPPARPTRRRRVRGPPPCPTNSLILCLPDSRVLDPLLPLLHGHFATYGKLHAWTPLISFGRVVVVFETAEEAARGKQEMDGFVWEDEHERGGGPPQPLRVYFGPLFRPERLAYLPRAVSGHAPPASSHLEVPSSGKNFLISPPGSPPVGWEQIEEDAPNTRTFYEGDASVTEVDFDELKKAGGGDDLRWADELTKALRFLSVQGGGDSDDEDPQPTEEDGEDDDDDEVMLDSREGRLGQGAGSKTQVVLAPAPLPPSATGPFPRAGSDSPSILRPAVTVSSPPAGSLRDSPSPPSATATPPPGATKISSVKATVDSMLGSTGSAFFTPTARPPLA